MKEEMNALEKEKRKNQTWEIIPQPRDKKPVRRR